MEDNNMATIAAVVSVHVVDSYGIPGQAAFFVGLDSTKTIDQLSVDVDDLVTIVQGLTEGIPVEGTVTMRFVTALDPSTAVGDIEKGGLFNFNNSSTAYATGYLIPDISSSILTAQGLIDLTNTAVTDFITYVTTAHTVITVVTKGVQALTHLRDALITFRKHRKPLTRRTKEV
jgi:hypothetical protein